MFKPLLHGITAALAFTLGGCANIYTPKVDMPKETSVQQPMPNPQLAMAAPTGGIYNASTYNPLFEDVRARHIGDILTIQINEQIDASQKNKTAANRSDSASINLPGIPFGFGSTNPLNSSASSSKAFAGDGTSTAANTLTGTITVTVADVLPNGNLRVIGEKQIGTNRDVQALKFSGVVMPTSIQAGNVVDSRKVADARLEYSGKGAIDAATTMGWLSRFFLSVLPF